MKALVLKMKEMNHLSTVEYTVTKIVRASDDKTWYKFGDRKILFSIEASIKAGVNLSEIKKNDIQIEGDKINLKIPHGKLLYLTIPAEKIKEEYSSVSIIRNSFSVSEKDGILKQGQKNIEKLIPSLGIIEDAEKSAKALLTSWLKQAGFKEININFK